jgi:hypothetical protein
MEFVQDFGILIGLAVLLLVALVIGLVLRKPADKKAAAAAGKKGGKGDKEEYLKDLNVLADGGKNGLYKDGPEIDLGDDGKEEYYKDDM